MPPIRSTYRLPSTSSTTDPCARSTAMPLISANPCSPGARCCCSLRTSSRLLGPGTGVSMWGAVSFTPTSPVGSPARGFDSRLSSAMRGHLYTAVSMSATCHDLRELRMQIRDDLYCGPAPGARGRVRSASVAPGVREAPIPETGAPKVAANAPPAPPSPIGRSALPCACSGQRGRKETHLHYSRSNGACRGHTVPETHRRWGAGGVFAATLGAPVSGVGASRTPGATLALRTHPRAPPPVQTASSRHPRLVLRAVVWLALVEVGGCARGDGREVGECSLPRVRLDARLAAPTER